MPQFKTDPFAELNTQLTERGYRGNLAARVLLETRETEIGWWAEPPNTLAYVKRYDMMHWSEIAAAKDFFGGLFDILLKDEREALELYQEPHIVRLF